MTKRQLLAKIQDAPEDAELYLDGIDSLFLDNVYVGEGVVLEIGGIVFRLIV